MFSIRTTLQTAMTDGAGFVTILISAGNSIRIGGVQAADLDAANFELSGSPSTKPTDQAEHVFLEVSFAVDPVFERLGDSGLVSTAINDQGGLKIMTEDDIGYDDGGVFL